MTPDTVSARPPSMVPDDQAAKNPLCLALGKLGPAWVMTISFALAMLLLVIIGIGLALLILNAFYSAVDNLEGTVYDFGPAIGDWACSSYWGFLLDARESGISSTEIETLFSRVVEESDGERIASVCGTPEEFYASLK